MYESVCRNVEAEWAEVLGGFPAFRCHARSDLPSRLRMGQPRNWVAIACLSGPIRDHFCDQHGEHNPIVFDERFLPEPLNANWLELVVAHELAHFMANDIDPAAAIHGHLWARCFLALGWTVCLDQIEIHEAFEQILYASPKQFHSQLQSDNCNSYPAWRAALAHQHDWIIKRLEMRNSAKLPYCEMLQICAAAA